MRFEPIRHASLPSTNDEARRLIRQDPARPVAVLAARQTAGRGRYGRPWASEPGNVYLSAAFALDLDAVPGRPMPGTLGYVAALALVDALETFSPERALAIKWPNDVLLGASKTAGVLAEAEAGAFVLGIGVNVAHHPAGTAFPATHLNDALPRPTDAVTAAARLIGALERRLAAFAARGFDPVRAGVDARLWRLGESVSVSLSADRAETVRGVNRGLSPDGRLRLALDDGTERLLSTGDVAAL